MREVHFQTLDLNLLRVFDALAEERSVTRAGERLGLTQSAVSHALNRLRYALEDELFVRGPEGMTPTPRAAEVWPELRRGLGQLQHALAPTEFDPASADRVFNLSASAYLCEVLLPRAIMRIREEAPGVELRIRSPDPNQAEGLETGRLDLAIGVFGRVAEVFARERLFEERLIWAVRADHPAAAEPLSLDRLRELPLVLLAPPSSERAAGERPGRGIERLGLWDDLGSDRTPLGRGALERIKVVVDTAHAALAIVGRTDMAALVPRRLAMTWSHMHGLKLAELGDEAAPATPVEAVWRADQSTHPALTWLRSVLRDTAREA